MTDAQQKAREIVDSLFGLSHVEFTFDHEAGMEVVTRHIEGMIKGPAGIDFVCAHCGALAWINETSIDNGCTLICVQCNEETLVELHTRKSYIAGDVLKAERDALDAMVETQRKRILELNLTADALRARVKELERAKKNPIRKGW